MVGEKFYLKPGSVVVASTGIFLISQDQLIPISGIAADSEGVYMVGGIAPGYCVVCGAKLKNGECPKGH